MLKGKVAAIANGAGTVATSIGTFRCNLPAGVRVDEEITFVVRPEHVVIGAGSAGENVVDGKLLTRTYLGEIAEYTIVTAGGSISSRGAAGDRREPGRSSEGDTADRQAGGGEGLNFRGVNMGIRYFALTLAASVMAMLIPGWEVNAQPGEDFFKGKRINLIIGTGPGGSYHSYAQSVARHLGRHIPGNPQIVTQNMPGAGSVVAANFLANVAPADGTTIATLQQSIPIMQLLGYANVKYDAAALKWIGDQVVSNSVMAVWHTTPVRSLEDATVHEVVLGAEGGARHLQHRAAGDRCGAGDEIQLVSGFPGGGEINLAMERGEISGRGAVTYAGWKAQKPQWLAEKKLFILAQSGSEPEPELPHVPMLGALAGNDDDRRLLDLVSMISELGRPLVAPPGVPAERVAMLRRAFDATMVDREFLADAAKQQMQIAPRSGEKMEGVLVRLAATPKPVVERLKAIVSAEIKCESGKDGCP